MARKFEDILDECLKRVLTNREEIEQCLRDHPEVAKELEPLLRAALAAAKAAPPSPRPEFKARTKELILSGIRVKVESKPRRTFLLTRWPRWAMATFLILVLVLLSISTVVVSAKSMPDEPLYPIKLATERLQLAFARSDISKVRLNAKFAERRAEEMARMAQEGRIRKVEELAERLAIHLERIGKVAAAQRVRAGIKSRNVAQLRALLIQYAIEHPAMLQRMLKRAPPQARPIIRRVIRLSAERYARAIWAVSPEVKGEGLPLRSWPLERRRVRIIGGVIRGIAGSIWIVDGRAIELAPDAVIEGEPQVGYWAKAEIQIQPDRSLLARRVEVRPLKGNRQGELK